MKNVGQIDKVVRIILGIAILSLLVILPMPKGLFGLIGLIPLGTGLMNFCPLYALFKISSCPRA